MSLDAKIDLERIAKACCMKDYDAAALAVGTAVLETADTALKYFRGSLELDFTDFVVERIGNVKNESFHKALKKKLSTIESPKAPNNDDDEGAPEIKPKRRGRKPNSVKAAAHG